MAENNTLLRHFFAPGADADPEGRFGLNSKSRRRRMREIIGIVGKHRALEGFTPEEFRAMLEDWARSFVKIGQNAFDAIGNPSQGVLRGAHQAPNGMRSAAVR